MHKTAFEIDDNIAIYDGYTDGTHWNGWACPWFTRDSKTVWNYLRSTYFYLNSKELYIIYHGILSEINGYMTMRELELYTDAFVRGYEAHKEVDYSLSK